MNQAIVFDWSEEGEKTGLKILHNKKETEQNIPQRIATNGRFMFHAILGLH